MDTAVRFMLAAILLFAMVNHAHADAGRDDAEVVLEADEIDSSTVAVGTFVVVVYEREEPPQSLSGAWAKLDTTRGYIKAVDRQGLLLSLKGWPQRIALDRIQTLTLSHKAAYGRAMRRLPETPDRFSVITDDMGSIKRIAIKLFSGAALGSFSAYLGGGIGAGFESCEGDCGFNEDAIVGAAIGYAAGTAYGVSRIDPHDQFFPSLLGSLLGFGAGIWLTANSDRELWPSIFVGPVILSTLMSELSRKPPEARRFSVDLVPNSNGDLSAVVTLRF